MSPLLCFSSTSLPLTTLFIYLSSHLFLSLRLVLLFSHSFSLRSWRQRLGCDPITGWLQQSPSADWFYNPHSGSQMGENQLAKKCCSESCHTDAHTHAPTYTHTRASFLSASISQFLTSHHCFHSLYKSSLWVYVHACVCMCGGRAMIEQQRGKESIHSAQVLYLKWTVIHLVRVCVCVCMLLAPLYVCAQIYSNNMCINIYVF